MNIRQLTAAFALTALAGAASAGISVQPGDIVFTSQQDDAIKIIGGVAPGPETTLYSMGTSNTARLSSIVLGPNGNFFVGDGAFPGSTASGIIEVSNLFSGASSASFATGAPFGNPETLVYDSRTNAFITVNNPSGQGFPNPGDAILSTPFANPAGTSPIFAEPAPGNPISYEAGVTITADPNSNDKFITTLNSGDGNGDNASISALWRLPESGAGFGAPQLVVDFSAATTSISDMFQVRGVAAVPGTNDLYVTEFAQGAIYRVSLDGSGNFDSMALVADGFSEPGQIAYNEYTNQLVFTERGGLTDSKINTINLDGTGLVTLDTGDHARGFYIVPTPGAATLLGLAGIAGLRRRR